MYQNYRFKNNITHPHTQEPPIGHRNHQPDKMIGKIIEMENPLDEETRSQTMSSDEKPMVVEDSSDDVINLATLEKNFERLVQIEDSRMEFNTDTTETRKLTDNKNIATRFNQAYRINSCKDTNATMANHNSSASSNSSIQYIEHVKNYSAIDLSHSCLKKLKVTFEDDKKNIYSMKEDIKKYPMNEDEADNLSETFRTKVKISEISTPNFNSSCLGDPIYKISNESNEQNKDKLNKKTMVNLCQGEDSTYMQRGSTDKKNNGFVGFNGWSKKEQLYVTAYSQARRVFRRKINQRFGEDEIDDIAEENKNTKRKKF